MGEGREPGIDAEKRGMRILGIDPGSNVTGYGVVDQDGSKVLHVAHGTLRTSRSESLAGRLTRIHQGLCEVVALHQPDLAVVEKAFVGSNASSALILGQARGAALVALGSAGLPIDEFTPGEIKRAVVGTGSAEKRQVQRMVRQLLSLSADPAEDAADALAAALCRAHQGPLAGLGRPSRPRSRGRSRAASFVVRRGR